VSFSVQYLRVCLSTVNCVCISDVLLSMCVVVVFAQHLYLPSQIGFIAATDLGVSRFIYVYRTSQLVLGRYTNGHTAS